MWLPMYSLYCSAVNTAGRKGNDYGVMGNYDGSEVSEENPSSVPIGFTMWWTCRYVVTYEPDTVCDRRVRLVWSG